MYIYSHSQSHLLLRLFEQARLESRRVHRLRTSPRVIGATSDEVAELVNPVPHCLRRGASIQNIY